MSNENNNSMVALTDYNWYLSLVDYSVDNRVNFWTPTPWNVKKLEKGNKVYFLLKQAYGRKICGWGSFIKYEIKNIPSAWAEYGVGNGVKNLEEFIYKVAKYTEKNSKTGYKGDIHEIGCLILDNVCLLPESMQKSPLDYGWVIPRNIVKYKYVNDDSSSDTNEQITENSFSLVCNDNKNYAVNRNKKRVGQPKFRKDVMRAYNYRCCITKESVSETIQAAHIQEYISEESNHIQNGLPLRVDFHSLFDAGLITLNENYEILVSSYLKSKYYRSFEGCKIDLPSSKNRPSIDSLRWHNINKFRK